MDQVLSVFTVEAREQLDAMESGLMGIEQGDRDPETLNAVFRAAHTIKGGAGVVELHAVERFTHLKRAGDAIGRQLRPFLGGQVMQLQELMEFFKVNPQHNRTGEDAMYWQNRHA